MSDKSLQLYRMIKYLREKVKGRRAFLRPLTLLSKKVWPSLTIRITLRFMPRLYAKGVQFDTTLREKCFPQRTRRCGKRLKLFFRFGEKTLRGFFDSLKPQRLLNSTPFVRQDGILNNKRGAFYAKRNTKQTIHTGIQEEGNRNDARRKAGLSRNGASV